MSEIAVIAGFLVAGWLAGMGGCWLLGRLRRGMSVHSGWCAAAVAWLWAVVGWRSIAGHLPAWWCPVPLLLTWFAVLLTATDLRHRRLPDALTLPAYPAAATLIAAAAWLGGGWSLVGGAVVGAVGLLGVYAAVHFLRPAALGLGDVKLSGSVGAVLGAVGWPAVVVAAWLAAVCTLGLGVMGRRRWRDGVPHGPGLLAAASLIALFPGALPSMPGGP